jgi:hypothetical protein
LGEGGLSLKRLIRFPPGTKGEKRVAERMTDLKAEGKAFDTLAASQKLALAWSEKTTQQGTGDASNALRTETDQLQISSDRTLLSSDYCSDS